MCPAVMLIPTESKGAEEVLELQHLAVDQMRDLRFSEATDAASRVTLLTANAPGVGHLTAVSPEGLAAELLLNTWGGRFGFQNPGGDADLPGWAFEAMRPLDPFPPPFSQVEGVPTAPTPL